MRPRASTAFLAFALFGCTVGPDFASPAPMAAPPATMAATLAAAHAGLPGNAAVDPAWWRVFGDPVLDQVEALALAGNLDVMVAGTRIGRARAALRIAGAAGLPQLSAAASYQRERASEDGILALTGAGSPPATAASGADPFGTTSLPGSTGGSGGGGGAFDLLQAGFDASWELDLWGRVRRLREAGRADADAAAFDRDAARISLGAEVARAYLHLRGAEARLAILRRNHTAVVAGQRIAEKRLADGAATRFDAATAGAQIAAIEGQIPAVEREAAEARNLLALLCGAEPHALDPMLANGAGAVPEMAASVPAALPSDLAKARPDIRAAEAVLHAATARIGAAQAEFYPSLSLAGSAGLQSLGLADLVGWSARQFVAGPVLRLPIFQGGRLQGRLDLTRADQQAAAIQYRATVLRAWHEVDDALEAVHAAAAQQGAARAGVDQGRIAAQVAERRYGAGATGYLDVLVAERARLDREVAWVAARTAHAVALTALLKALGGGWSSAMPTGRSGA